MALPNGLGAGGSCPKEAARIKGLKLYGLSGGLSPVFDNSSSGALLAHLHLLGNPSYLGERIAEAEESKECVESL